MTIGARIKELRASRGMTQAELAAIAGVTDKAVSTWEKGANVPRMGAIEKLASFFKVSKAYLMGETDSLVSVIRPSSGSIRIPVLGSIPAGIPIEAVEDIIDWEEIPADWLDGGKEFFSLRVKGDSMSPRYQDGDTLILRKQDTCESGQDCAVLVDGGDATFKRVRILPSGVTLQPLNPEYDPFVFSNREVAELPVRVLGVVVELRRKIG